METDVYVAAEAKVESVGNPSGNFVHSKFKYPKADCGETQDQPFGILGVPRSRATEGVRDFCRRRDRTPQPDQGWRDYPSCTPRQLFTIRIPD